MEQKAFSSSHAAWEALSAAASGLSPTAVGAVGEGGEGGKGGGATLPVLTRGGRLRVAALVLDDPGRGPRFELVPTTTGRGTRDFHMMLPLPSRASARDARPSDSRLLSVRRRGCVAAMRVGVR